MQAVFTYTGQPSTAGEEGADERQSTGQQSTTASQRQHGGLQSSPSQQQRAGQQQREEEQQLAEVRLSLGSTPLQLWCQQLAQSGDTATAAVAASGAQAAAEALAALVLACPGYFNNADVLELCGWDAPLASLAALRWCRRAVAAGANEAVVALLRRNALRNSHLFVIERLRLQQLAWQQQLEERQQQELQLLRAFPGGFQAVLAVVPATDAELQGMLAAASVQLSRRPGALLLMCASTAAEVQAAAAAAAALGMRGAAPLPPELAAAVCAVAESSGMHFAGLHRCERTSLDVAWM